MAKHRIRQITPHDTPGTLDIGEIGTGSLPTWAQNAGGVGYKWGLSTNNWL